VLSENQLIPCYLPYCSQNIACEKFKTPAEIIPQ